jgi:hypothetical protein
LAAGGARSYGRASASSGPRADQRDRHLELSLDELDVAARIFGQRAELGHLVERLVPARQRLVDRPAMVKVALMRGEVGRLCSVAQLVANADGQLREGREDVQLRQRERGDPVQAHRVAESDEVEPAAAPLAAGGGAELGAQVSHALLIGAFDLGRERPLADPRDVGLRDADDGVDAVRPDADADCGRPGNGSGRGHERIRAVVEVEQRPLRSFEQHEPALAQRAVDEQRGVGDVRSQPLRELLVARRQLLELERLCAVDAFEPDVLLGERDLDLLAQDLRVEQVLDADSEPRRLVGIGRADSSFRRPDLQLPEPPLAALVDGDVPRHDQVRLARDAHAVGRDSARLELVELSHEDLGVDHAARAEDALLAVQDPGGHVVELVLLAARDDRVARIRAALVAADEVRVLGEQVDDLALALVAPLRPDDDGRGHAPEFA